METGTLRTVASEISGYFRDFLDSDFKRQQAPRRRIVLTSESGFRAGLRTSPYPGLDRDLWTLLSKPISEELSLTITPRKYTRPISEVLRKVIAEQVNAIPAGAITTVRSAVLDRASSTYTKAVEHPEEWIESVQRELAEQIGECIKPINEFRGSIGQALNHYVNVLENAKRLPSVEDTDQSSPMEAKVLEWFQLTPFYQANQDSIEVFAQFEVGPYLKQLDPTYEHPAWRVDFLVTYQSPKGPVQIVIEYDGFREHFTQGKHVHVGNHERYLHEADVERQLTLESYGYRFLRINRFNLGTDPVATMSERLYRLVEMAIGQPASAAVDHVQAQAAGLASKELKACSRCGKIQDQAAYFDPALRDGAGGYGRVCLSCKSATAGGRQASSGRRHRRWRY